MYRAPTGRALGAVLVLAATACADRGAPTAADTDATIRESVAPAAVSTDGLVAYYPFEGDAADASGNGHDGAIHNGVGFGPGPRGTSATFSSGDYVRVADHDQLDTDQAMTVAAWVNPTTLSVSGSIFLSKWFSSPVIGDWILRVHPSGSGGRLLANAADYDLDSGQTLPGEIYALTQSGAEMPVGEWSFVAMTFGSSTLSIYVNGELVGQVATAFSEIEPDEYATDDLFIGDFRGIGSTVYLFNGGIDEVRIYDRALSQDEIVSLYADPQDKDECKNGGWDAYGFRNQGQCVRFFETGKDSRVG